VSLTVSLTVAAPTDGSCVGDTAEHTDHAAQRQGADGEGPREAAAPSRAVSTMATMEITRSACALGLVGLVGPPGHVT
jgi:hypothetical protein